MSTNIQHPDAFELVCCPSVFGVYPPLHKQGGLVRLGGETLGCTLRDAWWDAGRFVFDAVLRASPGDVTLRVTGGASSQRGLSQAIFSQCLEVCQPGSVAPFDTFGAEELSDFVFDQVVQDGMRGSFRQQSGINGTPWLSASGIHELSLRLDHPAQLLGTILRHPAAYLAAGWRSMGPMDGSTGRVPHELSVLLQRSAKHYRSGGCLVVGSTAHRGASKQSSKLFIPDKGWIVTGQRGGIEAQARRIARRECRPLLVVSRLEDVEPILHKDIFTSVVVDHNNKPIGRFRQKIVESLGGSRGLEQSATA